MTDPNYTAISLLIDRSGSMGRIKTATEAAINEFVQGQGTETITGRRTIRIATFDHAYKVLHASMNPVNVPRFHLDPGGSTALLDAMGYGIEDFGAELAALPEPQRPSTVIFAIMTDGEENSSLDYTFPEVAAKVGQQEKDYGWRFIYLGANQDAIASAAKVGIASHNSVTYRASDIGTRSVVAAATAYVNRSGLYPGGQSVSFTDDERADSLR